SKEDDYFKPLTESETEIHNELGTGNISMSVYDLDTLFTQVLSGKLVSKDILFSLWRENANGHPYSGGVYSGDNYILSQGNIDSFDTASVFSKDSQDAVIMESNVKPDKTIKLPTGYLRNQIYDLMEETNKLATS
ncbi:MAG: serine hydrolase, partial [Enterococcus faecium]|nr:serine hydrolase [Enterococcus faecium]